MESVFFYEKRIEKDVFDILSSDEFMRVSRVIRDSDILHGGKGAKGSLLYVTGDRFELDALSTKLVVIGVERVRDDDAISIINIIKAEEDNAASGMGMIFG